MRERMKKSWKVLRICALLLVLPFIGNSGSPGSVSFNPNLYITPALKYSVLGKGLALMYEPQLVSMATRINQEMKSDRFELIDLNTSPMGSIGLFSSPSSLTPSIRFLGVTARVNILLTYFPDTDGGRLADAMDAFGKDLLVILGSTLSSMQDLSVRGAVLILIYSKAKLSDPNYYDQAEAVAIFIPRETLQQFNSFRIRFDTLFSQSEIFSFKGRSEIQTMFNEFMKG